MAQRTWRERLAGQDNPSGPLHPEGSRVSKGMGKGNQNVLSKKTSEFTESGRPRTLGEGECVKIYNNKANLFLPRAPGGIGIITTPTGAPKTLSSQGELPS